LSECECINEGGTAGGTGRGLSTGGTNMGETTSGCLAGNRGGIVWTGVDWLCIDGCGCTKVDGGVGVADM